MTAAQGTQYRKRVCGQLSGLVANVQRVPGQHQLAGDRHRRRLGAQVAGNHQPVAAHHDPVLVFVVVDDEMVQPGVGQVGLVVPQGDQVAIEPVQPGVFAGADLRPVQLGALEGLRILRVGDVVGVPAVLGELGFASLGGGAGQLRLGVRAEELERSRRPPFLAHEKHCSVG